MCRRYYGRTGKGPKTRDGQPPGLGCRICVRARTTKDARKVIVLHMSRATNSLEGKERGWKGEEERKEKEMKKEKRKNETREEGNREGG